MKPKNDQWEDYGKLFKFAQGEFFKSKDEKDMSGMRDFGAIFIPDKCNEGQVCNVHVNLHGCFS